MQPVKPAIQYIDRPIIEAPPFYLQPHCDAAVPQDVALVNVGSLLDAYLKVSASLDACAMQAMTLWWWGTRGASLQP